MNKYEQIMNKYEQIIVIVDIEQQDEQMYHKRRRQPTNASEPTGERVPIELSDN